MLLLTPVMTRHGNLALKKQDLGSNNKPHQPFKADARIIFKAWV